MKTIVDVEKLNIKLVELFEQEIANLQLGYFINYKAMAQIMNLVHVIDLIQNTPLKPIEVLKLVQIYGKE